MGHHLSNELLLAALLLDLLALLLGRLLFRLLLLQLLLFLLLYLLSVEFLLATLFLCCTRKKRSVRKCFLPAHSIIRVTAPTSSALSFCQCSVLCE